MSKKSNSKPKDSNVFNNVPIIVQESNSKPKESNVSNNVPVIVQDKL